MHIQISLPSLSPMKLAAAIFSRRRKNSWRGRILSRGSKSRQMWTCFTPSRRWVLSVSTRTHDRSWVLTFPHLQHSSKNTCMHTTTCQLCVILPPPLALNWSVRIFLRLVSNCSRACPQVVLLCPKYHHWRLQTCTTHEYTQSM